MFDPQWEDPWAIPSWCDVSLRPFVRVIAQWQEAQPRWDVAAKACYIRSPVTGRLVDASFTGYADDLFKKIVVEVNSAELAKEKSDRSNHELQLVLGPAGYKQNVTKQEVVVSFKGILSHTEKRNIKQGEVFFLAYFAMRPGTWATGTAGTTPTLLRSD